MCLHPLVRFFFNKSCSIFGVLIVTATSIDAQDFVLPELTADQIRLEANAIVALVGLVSQPDITTSNLSIDNNRGDDTSVSITQLGDGFIVDDDFPLYLEGVLGILRYDPNFVATQGTQQRRLPLKWNTIAGTAGVGWNFPITDDLSLRPIVNVSLAHIESDLSIAGRVIEDRTGVELDFLENGRMNIFGYGGALMLDYERYREAYEIDIELRYSYMRFQTFESSGTAQGTADAITATLWSRYREPTGVEVMNRPLRYLLEVAYSEFIGDQGDALGVDRLGSLGAGLELDFSGINEIVSRARLTGRFLIGDNVSGFSTGLGVSF